MAHKFTASDEFIAWSQSLSGMLTSIRTKFGSIADMVEGPTWDEGKTKYILALIKSLHAQLARIDEELTSHVEDKYGSDH